MLGEVLCGQVATLLQQGDTVCRNLLEMDGELICPFFQRCRVGEKLHQKTSSVEFSSSYPYFFLNPKVSFQGSSMHMLDVDA